MAFAALLAALAAAAAPMVAAKDYDYCKKDCPRCKGLKCKYGKCVKPCIKQQDFCDPKHDKCCPGFECIKNFKGNYKCRKAKTCAKAGESCHKLPCCNKGHLVCDKKNYVCVKPKKCGKKGDDCGGKDDLPCCNKFGLKGEDYKCIKPKTCAKKGQSCSDLPCCNGWGLVCDKGNICTKPAKCAKLGQECKYTPCCNNKAGVKCYATTDKCCIEKDYPCKYDSDCCDGHCYDYAKGKGPSKKKCVSH